VLILLISLANPKFLTRHAPAISMPKSEVDKFLDQQNVFLDKPTFYLAYKKN